jgi:hypothetical protein
MLRCKRAAPFINALSAFYTRAPCKLKDLRVCLRKSKGDENDDVVHAIQSLLSCVSPLEELYIETGTDELVDLNYLTQFGSSLRTLCLGSNLVQAISYLGLGDYDKLSQVCPLLDQLAIDLCPVSIEELQ